PDIPTITFFWLFPELISDMSKHRYYYLVADSNRKRNNVTDPRPESQFLLHKKCADFLDESDESEASR
ncbi:hypothetical protein KIV40_33765, partial [Vibrio sp. D173a]|uniref:hypothetical protein n=1 Tax=Vibrio sp. D173a TaxID=2836349 RepID=UPI0025549DBA